MGDGESFGIN
jgi:hypothetical protein